MTGPRLCPVCRHPLREDEALVRYRPFCSKRCADIDLGRWLKGTYAIPAVEAEPGENDDAPDPRPRGETEH